MTVFSPPRVPGFGAVLLLVTVVVAGCASLSRGGDAGQDQAGNEVPVGLGGQDRTGVSGAVATVRAEDLDREITSMEELFQGLAGVTVRRLPNGGISLRIRGSSSLSSSGEPLYVINGVPVHAPPGQALLGVSPRDITRIEILKDAGATAIYGSRGANGVVLIFTVKRDLTPG
jgi:TonB-dependent SusC/RagA subfamily outer membrane receptor